MPDISLCKPKSCPKAKECYRFMAKPDPFYQSYVIDNKPYPKCKIFWPLEK